MQCDMRVPQLHESGVPASGGLTQTREHRRDTAYPARDRGRQTLANAARGALTLEATAIDRSPKIAMTNTVSRSYGPVPLDPAHTCR